MKKIIKKRHRRFSMPEISLTPLIDTALTLLIIFIITAPITQNGIKVDLPQGKSKEVDTTQEFVITINPADKNDVNNKNVVTYFNSFPVAENELVDLVKKNLAEKQNVPVFVRGDKTVPYGKVIEIVDSLKQAGVKYVAMSTKPSA